MWSRGFTTCLAYQIGMIRWGKEDGPPGGLTKKRIILWEGLIKEEKRKFEQHALNIIWSQSSMESRA